MSNASHSLETTYQDAKLKLQFDECGQAALLINGLVRETTQLGAKQTGTLRLGTPVQTDYEWHEYIEGCVEYGVDTITASLKASQTELLNTQLVRSTGSKTDTDSTNRETT